MKRIVLFCAGGMSTSLIVNRMRAAASLEEYSIDAYGFGELDDKGKDANVILLGPQVRYAINNVKKHIRTHRLQALKCVSMA